MKLKTLKKYPNIQFYEKKNGSKTYYARYRNKLGESKRIKVGSSAEGMKASDAEAERIGIINAQNKGEPTPRIAISKKDLLSVDQVANLYFESKPNTKSTRERQGKYKKHIAPVIGDKPIIDVIKDDLVKIQKRMQNPPKKKHIKKVPRPKSNRTINIVIELYSTIFNYGFKQELYNTTNVTKKYTKLKVTNATRERYLELVEIEELYHVVSNFDKDSNFKLLELFCRLAITIGARLESILNIKVKDINFNTDIITITDFKNNEARYSTYITDTTKEYLLSVIQNKRTNDYIFEFENKKVTKRQIQQRLKPILDDLFNQDLEINDSTNRAVIHSLRHTFASHLAINNISIKTIQVLMNHKDIKQTMKYAKLHNDTAKNAVQDVF